MHKAFFIFSAVFFLSCSNSATNEKSSAVGNTDIPEQEKNLRKSIEAYPDSLVLRNNLVTYFAENGNYWNAIKENDLILQRDSNDADIWDTKARLLFLNRDTANAAKAMEKTIQILPAPKYVIFLGTLYAQTKNPIALQLADNLLRTPGSDASLQALFIKGLYFSNTGDKIKAIYFYDECIRISYTFLDAYREKAINLYDLGKYLESLKTLELELALSRENEEAYYWMGRCFEKLGEKDEAVENYKMALQFDKNYAEAKDALGKLGVVL